MNAHRALFLTLCLAAGCGNTDVCGGVKGTCVDLTIRSTSITAIDAVDITAAGAVNQTQHSATGKAVSLPLHVPLIFSSVTSGDVTITVSAQLGSVVLGVGTSTPITLVAGAHLQVSVDVEGGGTDGGVDLSGDDLTDVDLNMPDLATPICDPRGINPPFCVWRWQTPSPVGEDIVSVHSFADNDTFALTQSGAILHRDGTGWSILPARPKAAIGTFVARHMAGGSGGVTDLFIVGFTSPSSNTVFEVFHSADKGASWIEEPLPATATVGNDYFDGITVGVGGDAILAGDFSHIVTRNHSTGAWSDYQTDATCAPPSTGCSTNYRTVTSSVLANVAVYDTYKFSRANVGTNTWTTNNGPDTTDIVNYMCYGHDFGNTMLRYFGVGYNGVVESSTDSTSWSAQISNTSAILYGCTTSNNLNAWAFGANGTIVATTNGGLAGTGTWAGQTSGTNEVLLSGSHSPGTSLTIVGQAGTILRSMNGGTSYTSEQTGPSGSWISILGITPKNVYAAGNTGSIVHTTDGSTWAPVAASGTTNTLIAMWASSASDVYAVGTMGTLVHSTDGTNFTKYNNPGSGGIPAGATLVDIAGLAANNVFVAADTGLYRSTDNGVSFAPVVISGFTGPAVTALFAMGGGLWVGGNNGQIYYTTDGVAFASQSLTGIGASLPINRIRGRLPSELYASSSAGGWLAHTTNGGAMWTNGVVASISAPFDLAVTPTGNVYVSGGGLALSTDGGMNFVPVNTAPVPTSQVALYVASESEIFATDGIGIVHFGN